MTQTKIFEIMDEVGFPEGVVNMVHGSRDVVNGMLDHPDIEGIFSSVQHRRRNIFISAAAKPASGSRRWAAPRTSWPSCPDADLVAGMPSLITSFIGCSGQRCLSGSILAAVGDAADRIVEKFTIAAQSVKVGDGLDEQTAWGRSSVPLTKNACWDIIEKGIAKART